MSSTTTREAASPTRSIDGHVLPTSGRCNIDPGHTDLAFVGRHFMVTKVRGRFTDITGSVTIADRFTLSRAVR
jgi:polyisoprenoid-binding protein YceI